MARRVKNGRDMNDRGKKPYDVDIRVTTRARPSIIWAVIEGIVGMAILAIICVTLLTGIGAIIVNLGTTGNLPQPVVDISTGFYNYFF